MLHEPCQGNNLRSSGKMICPLIQFSFSGALKLSPPPNGDQAIGTIPSFKHLSSVLSVNACRAFTDISN